jgi:hypothetical protein
MRFRRIKARWNLHCVGVEGGDTGWTMRIRMREHSESPRDSCGNDQVLSMRPVLCSPGEVRMASETVVVLLRCPPCLEKVQMLVVLFSSSPPWGRSVDCIQYRDM